MRVVTALSLLVELTVVLISAESAGMALTAVAVRAAQVHANSAAIVESIVDSEWPEEVEAGSWGKQ